MKEQAGKPVKGIHTDYTEKDQPPNSYRYALNAVDDTEEGHSTSLSNEESNEICADLPENYRPIGKVYIGDDRTALLLANNITGDSEIGILDSYCKYTTHVNDSGQIDKLNFSIEHQIDATYRLRRGCEDNIYFVDGNNTDRQYNFAKPGDFQTPSGDWDINKFKLDKTTQFIPNINSVVINESGDLPPGSYNVGIVLLDSNLNSTEVLNISDTIIIYHDSYTEDFNSITGSTTEIADYYQYGKTGKGLTVNLSDLDPSFDYYRVFLIAANNASGAISSITYSEDIPIDQVQFILTGDNTPFASNIAEVKLISARIASSEHIEQIDNRLVRANVKGDQRDYCAMQKLASKVKSNLILQTIKLNDINSFGNPKRGTVHEENALGYMPREIYAIGLVYTFPDGFESPALHIPGRAAGDLTSQMSLDNESTNQRYQEDQCSQSPYWGKDFTGADLAGEKVRHHRFPSRADLSLPLYTENIITNDPTGTYNHTVKITMSDSYNDNYNYDTIYIRVKYDNAETGETNVEYIKSFPNPYFNNDPLDLEFFIPEIITDSAVNPYIINQVKFVNPQGNDHPLFIDPAQTIGPIVFPTLDLSEPILNKLVEYSSQIMGIEFFNIELPPGASGYHIVRMERIDSEKTVLDTGLLFPLMKDTNYEAFGGFNPANDITRSTERWALINPEYKFKGTEHTGISSIIRESRYVVNQKTMISQISEDVQPGTSYNKSVAKKREEDEDGFDLHTLVRHQAFTNVPDGTVLTTDITDTRYLSALSSTVMQGETVFNVSADNKIGILEFDSAQGTYNNIPYVSLIKDRVDHYSNFRTGKYYKEHTTLSQVTNSGFAVFNGDTYMSSMTLTNTMFYDIRLRHRSAKSGVWRVIGGSLLIAFGIVATVLTLGLGVPVTAFIIGAGLSGVASGINQAIIKKTYQEEYEKGLKETIRDADTDAEFNVNPADDEVQYFVDMMENIWFESTVNMNWRLSPNYGPELFQYSPNFLNKNRINNYILDKLSVIDTENESGRLYQGFASAEVYFINKDYLRRNREKVHFALDEQYDCCSDCREEFPQRVHWSEQSFQEELSDNFRSFLPNNYKDIEGELGPITDLFKIQNNLYIHTKEGLWHLPQDIQERITGDVISFIGTGEYFGIPPRKIVDDESGLSAGNENKWGTIKTPYGVFFPCEAQGTVYQFNGSNLQPISSQGNFSWFKEHLPLRANEAWKSVKGRAYRYLGNTANKFGIGFHAAYDSRKERILFTKRDLVYNPAIVTSVPVIGEDGNPLPIRDTTDFEMTYYQGQVYIFDFYQELINTYLAAGYIFDGIVGDALVFTIYNVATDSIDTISVRGRLLVNEALIENASWTYSYSIKNQAWRSFHSFLPTFYINTPEVFHSYIYDTNSIWKHGMKGNFQNFYGVRYAFMIDYISNSTSVETRIFNHIKLLTDARKYVASKDSYVDERFITFNKMWIYNSRQLSGELNLTVKDTAASPVFYIDQQITDISGDEIIIDRQERDWTINDLRDVRIDYDVPMFTKAIQDLQVGYFADKLINNASIDFNKDWTQLESFRDKYLGIRLIFDTFDDIKLIVDYSIVNEQKSDR